MSEPLDLEDGKAVEVSAGKHRESPFVFIIFPLYLYLALSN